jgi:hypothetical protein
MKVYCHTNLDLAGEEWPTELPALPNVGDEIRSGIIHSRENGDEFQLTLQVVKISWVKLTSHTTTFWYPEIELHMTDWQRKLPAKDNQDGRIADGSITAFYQWYAPLVGRSVGSFI